MTHRFSLALSQLIRLIRQPPASGRLVAYPKLRNFIIDIMAEGRRKNIINLQFEADITPLQQYLIHHSEQSGGHLSLTACIAKTLATAVDDEKSMHAYRKGKSRLVLFDEIDLSIMIEREIEETILPVAFILRAANHKGIGEIDQELKAAKTAPLGEGGPMSALEKRFFKLPSLLRKTIWFVIRQDPHLFKQLAGTVGITSMGMHANSPMVLIPITPMTLTLSIGSIAKKLVLDHQNLPVERQFIQMNLSADHDIIDGAPLVRFADRFRRQLEEVSALPDSHPIS